VKDFSLDRFKQIADRFPGKRVMVVGDLMIDEYLVGKVSRISPEAPVPVVDIANEELRFGGAANVANNIQSLGAQPVIIGVIGNDRMGETFREILNQREMTTEGILVLDDRPTTLKTRVIGHSQHVVRIDRESRNYLNAEQEQQLLRKVSSLLPKCDAVILEDYNKGVLTEKVITETIRIATENNIPVTVDPKFTHFSAYRGVTVFKPNIKETEEALAIHIATDELLHEAGMRLLQMLQAKSVLITRGSRGMSLFEADGSETHVPTRARHVADVSGAGDTVISTLTLALIGGASPREAATMANYAAGIVCEEVGIVPIELDKLKEACVGPAVHD
jgi:rfaE bifunctional protein kinase chain/domain